MSVISITYEAKCKHCQNLEPVYKRSKKGKLYKACHQCKVTLNKQLPTDAACDNFKL